MWAVSWTLNDELSYVVTWFVSRKLFFQRTLRQMWLFLESRFKMLRTSDNVHVISKDLYVPLKRKCYSQILPLWLSIPLTFTKLPVVLHFKITCSFMASNVSDYTFSAFFLYIMNFMLKWIISRVISVISLNLLTHQYYGIRWENLVERQWVIPWFPQTWIYANHSLPVVGELQMSPVEKKPFNYVHT